MMVSRVLIIVFSFSENVSLEEDLGPKDSRQLAFESFHSLVPKDVIKMCNDKYCLFVTVLIF